MDKPGTTLAEKPAVEEPGSTSKRTRNLKRFALSALIALTVVAIAVASLLASASPGDGDGSTDGTTGIAPLEQPGTDGQGGTDGADPNVSGSAEGGIGGVEDPASGDGLGDGGVTGSDITVPSLEQGQNGEDPNAPQGDGTAGEPMGIDPLFTTVPGVGTVNASITDADNGVVEFDGSDGKNSTAEMSWSQITNHISNVYNLRVDLTDMPSDQTNILTVTLPLGMRFQQTNIANYIAQAGQFANDVASSSYTRGTSPAAGFTAYYGTYSFTLKPGVQASTANIPIQFDSAVNTDTITNAITIKLSNSTGTVSEVLSKVARDVDTGIKLIPGATTNAFFFTDNDVITPGSDRRSFMVQGIGNTFTCLIASTTYNIKLSDPRALLVNTDTTGDWTLDSSDAATGNYSFAYTPTAGVVYAASPAIPYSVEFPASAGWQDGDKVTLVYTAGTQVAYKQFDVDNPAGNTGSTISTTSNTAALTANVGTLTFTYQQPGEKVYVNYTSPSSYVTSGMTNPAQNFAFAANIDCGNTNPALNDETGVLGYFYTGNAGVTDSAAKSVDLHFDSAAYGVLGVYVPYTAGSTLASVRYKTTAQTSWQTKTVNVVADMYGRAYISYMTLGLNNNRAEFITDLSYELGVLPAGSMISNGTLTVYQCFFFGKWLGSNDLTTSGQASIRVYDTTGTANDTGAGYVTTTRRDGNVFSSCVIAPAVTATAG